MTLQEFLLWDHPGPLRYDLVDGEPRTIPLGTNGHGLLHAELTAVVGNHLHARKSSCLLASNVGIIPSHRPHDNFRVADLAVTRAPIRANQYGLPEPVLIADIVAPDDVARTWANVWTYMSIPSVTEILVLHSDRVAVNLLCRAEDETWPNNTAPIMCDALELTSIGLSLSLVELYARTGLID